MKVTVIPVEAETFVSTPWMKMKENEKIDKYFDLEKEL